MTNRNDVNAVVNHDSVKGGTNMKNYEMTVRRLMSVVVPAHDGEKQSAMVAAMLKNVQALGFTFSGALFTALLTQTADFLKEFYTELMAALRSLVGADREYTLFYPNFPSQVAEASDAELIVNAFIHYLTGGTLVPDYPKEERFPLIGEYPLKEIGLCEEEDVMKIFTNLLASPVSISEQDREDIRWFIGNTDYAAYLPSDIPMKETCAFFGQLMLQKGDAESAKALIRTATDVLRLIAAMSGQDVSLSGSVRIRKMKRSERRFIMDLLAGCGDVLEDMFRQRDLWVIVGEIVHPGEFSGRKQYSKVVRAFEQIRRDDKPLFFAGQVEAAVAEGDWDTASNLLMTRPGEFARMLDRLLRIEGAYAGEVIRRFSSVAGRVSTRVLWQVKAHFDHRCDGKEARAFFPKGNEAKCRLVKNELAYIPEHVCRAASKACYDAILGQYAERPDMGAVYVDPALKGYAAPFTQRSASSGFMQVARGSRLPFSRDCRIIRPFIWWTNREDGERVDVDLSVSFLSEDWKFRSEVSYCTVSNRELMAYHSGDIVNGGPFGGDGASEFVDFEPAWLLEKGVRYAVVQVHMYSCQPFSTLPCFFGWQERADAESGEVFEPKTVANRIAITADATSAVPAIVDCLTGEIVWADMTERSSLRFGGNNVYSNANATLATAWAVVNWEKPSLYDIVTANAQARGALVDSREEADIIFSNDSTRPMVRIVETDEYGRSVVKEAEKAVEIRDAFDLAFYMGEML